jgi:hypothetical protein
MLLPNKYQIFFLALVKITFFVFLLLSLLILLLLILFGILQVLSFVVGNEQIWLLRWQNQPGAKFVIAFNPLFLFLIVAGISSIKVLLKRKKRKWL